MSVQPTLSEDFLAIDAKSLFKNQAVLSGPKAPINAPSGMAGQITQHVFDRDIKQLPDDYAGSSIIELAAKHGYVRPSERQQAAQVHQQQRGGYVPPMPINPPIDYSQEPQRYFQYQAPVYQAPNVEQYKQALGGLLDILANKLTYAEWQSNPAIANAMKMLQ